MPSVVKASAEEPPRALREVDRLTERTLKMAANAGSTSYGYIAQIQLPECQG